MADVCFGYVQVAGDGGEAAPAPPGGRRHHFHGFAGLQLPSSCESLEPVFVRHSSKLLDSQIPFSQLIM